MCSTWIFKYSKVTVTFIFKLFLEKSSKCRCEYNFLVHTSTQPPIKKNKKYLPTCPKRFTIAHSHKILKTVRITSTFLLIKKKRKINKFENGTLTFRIQNWKRLRPRRGHEWRSHVRHLSPTCYTADLKRTDGLTWAFFPFPHLSVPSFGDILSSPSVIRRGSSSFLR